MCVCGGGGWWWCRLHANTVPVRGYVSKNCKAYLAQHRTVFTLREVKGIFGVTDIRKSGTINRDCGYKVNKTVVTARLCSCLRYERRVLKSSVGTHSEQSTHGISYWRKSKNNHTVKWGYEYSEQMVGNVSSVCVCVCVCVCVYIAYCIPKTCFENLDVIASPFRTQLTDKVFEGKYFHICGVSRDFSSPFSYIFPYIHPVSTFSKCLLALRIKEVDIWLNRLLFLDRRYWMSRPTSDFMALSCVK